MSKKDSTLPERILALKAKQAEVNLQPGALYEKCYNAGFYVSNSTIRRILKQGSEEQGFNEINIEALEYVLLGKEPTVKRPVSVEELKSTLVEKQGALDELKLSYDQLQQNYRELQEEKHDLEQLLETQHSLNATYKEQIETYKDQLAIYKDQLAIYKDQFTKNR